MREACTSTETHHASRRRDREREIQLAAAAAVPSLEVCLRHVNCLALTTVDVLTADGSTPESRTLLVERIAVALQTAGTRMLETIEVRRRAEAGDQHAQAIVAASRLRTAPTGRPV